MASAERFCVPRTFSVEKKKNEACTESMENANNFELFTDMTMDDVREYEKNMHEKTNIKVCNQHSSTVDEIESHAKARVCQFLKHIAHPQSIHLHRPEKSKQLLISQWNFGEVLLQ